jgi:hypothetical protein
MSMGARVKSNADKFFFSFKNVKKIKIGIISFKDRLQCGVNNAKLERFRNAKYFVLFFQRHWLSAIFALV